MKNPKTTTKPSRRTTRKSRSATTTPPSHTHSHSPAPTLASAYKDLVKLYSSLVLQNGLLLEAVSTFTDSLDALKGKAKKPFPLSKLVNGFLNAVIHYGSGTGAVLLQLSSILSSFKSLITPSPKK